jgi:hypothetical protein
MNIINPVALFFAGAFLCNGVPHLTSGLQGIPFPTPFAKPSGIGESSPVVNFLWGSFNLLAGILLLSRYPVSVGLNPGFLLLLAGALLMGLMTSLHFGRVRSAATRPGKQKNAER